MAFRFGREREREGGGAGEMRFMHALWLPNWYGFFFLQRDWWIKWREGGSSWVAWSLSDCVASNFIIYFHSFRFILTLIFTLILFYKQVDNYWYYIVTNYCFQTYQSFAFISKLLLLLLVIGCWRTVLMIHFHKQESRTRIRESKNFNALNHRHESRKFDANFT